MCRHNTGSFLELGAGFMLDRWVFNDLTYKKNTSENGQVQKKAANGKRQTLDNF